jgi:3-deoxy-D-manno-octulosonic-acid transferase
VYGRPILFGPHMQNFKEIAAAFLDARAALQVRDEWELEAAFRDLLADGGSRQALGRAARAILDASHGARDRTIAAIAQLLPPGEGKKKVRPFRIVRS